ncbi:hypothetical protein B0E33_11855 [Roseibium algicola]|uniref:Transposase n=1 Tax=Roseibium algicola TaxID=2857014 RepID=A0ABM6I1W4_9HYPH|nr:hypothetical protein ACP90_00345 [Labrenzia sp. CP4]AQQ04192.1 hypothetical protein B0E33_11855 [Roseibium aggregatum]
MDRILTEITVVFSHNRRQTGAVKVILTLFFCGVAKALLPAETAASRGGKGSSLRWGRETLFQGLSALVKW